MLFLFLISFFNRGEKGSKASVAGADIETVYPLGTAVNNKIDILYNFTPEFIQHPDNYRNNFNAVMLISALVGVLGLIISIFTSIFVVRPLLQTHSFDYNNNDDDFDELESSE